MPDAVVTTSSASETQRIAHLLGEGCTGGEAFLLLGPLGAGKTCFTQGLAWGLGVNEYTHSPTFVLVTEYHGRLTLYHMDLYRIESVPEAIDLGLEEYLTSGDVTAIEWADKALEALPEGLVVELKPLDGDRRSLSFHPLDAKHQALLDRAVARWERESAKPQAAR